MFRGKFLVLAVMAFVPARAGLNPRFLLAGGALLLMAGTYLRWSHALFLAAVAVPFGAALKMAEPAEKLAIVLAIAGLGLGMPLGSFAGMAVAASKFHPSAIAQLLPATLGITAVAMASAYAGVYMLLRLKLRR